MVATEDRYIQVKKLTKEQRLLRVIEEISADGECTEEVYGQKQICEIYKLVHTYNSPACRKNHPEWTKDFEKI